MIGNFLLKVIANILPLFLMLVGQKQSFADSIYKYFNISFITLDDFMLYSFGLGVLTIYIYYPFQLYVLKNKNKKKNDQLKEVLKEIRIIFSKTLGKEVKEFNLKLNVRKFYPQPFYEKPIKYWLRFDKKYFNVKHYDFLCDNVNNENFCFQVSPIQRGLVGVVYNQKKMIYDDKISERKEKYNLNNNHLTNNIISNTDFVLAKPFVSNKGKVKYIITFDTEQNVELPTDEKKKKEIDKLMIYYSDLFGNLLNNLN